MHKLAWRHIRHAVYTRIYVFKVDRLQITLVKVRFFLGGGGGGGGGGGNFGFFSKNKVLALLPPVTDKSVTLPSLPHGMLHAIETSEHFACKRKMFEYE